MIVYLDTNIVIYLVEHNPTWSPKAISRLSQLRADGGEIAVSGVAKLEALIHPIRLAATSALAGWARFFTDPAVRLLNVNEPTWERAAHIAAAQNFKPLDALHLAAAIEHGCGLFLTNDVQLSRCPDIAVEVLT